VTGRQRIEAGLQALLARTGFSYKTVSNETIALVPATRSETDAALDLASAQTQPQPAPTTQPQPTPNQPVTEEITVVGLAESLQDAYTQKSSSNDPNASALVSWRNDANNMGVLLSAVLDKRNIRRDGVEVLGYFPDTTTGLLVPSLIGSALFQQERERKAFNG